MFAYQGAYTESDDIPDLEIREVGMRLFSPIMRFFQKHHQIADDEDYCDEGRSRASSCCSFTEARRRQRKKRGKRVPSMVKEKTTYLVIPPLYSRLRNETLTIVLDLDETLAFGRQGPIVKRPHLDKFLHFLGTLPCCEVVVWTAGVRSYAQRIIAAIDPERVIEHCIYRHSKWYPASPHECYTKNLALTGRHPDRTLIIDNTPDCVIRNAMNGIICPDFIGDTNDDPTLLSFIDLLRELVESGKTVPEFVANCSDLKLLPVLDMRRVEYKCYFLDQSRWGGPSIQSADTRRKINRDLIMPTVAKTNPLGNGGPPKSYNTMS
eukprot:TRINITY_DN1394_c0_g1_i1.p1 TRINITY_DN1394_c0_g1~~TRINITY_DN1394_c0_g1_i1.p1  ORF type:complete len:322 (+),score=43.05 TRINITY_DN1394_c0_g1_i1:46-1011(+)